MMVIVDHQSWLTEVMRQEKSPAAGGLGCSNGPRRALELVIGGGCELAVKKGIYGQRKSGSC